LNKIRVPLNRDKVAFSKKFLLKIIELVIVSKLKKILIKPKNTMTEKQSFRTLMICRVLERSSSNFFQKESKSLVLSASFWTVFKLRVCILCFLTRAIRKQTKSKILRCHTHLTKQYGR